MADLTPQVGLGTSALAGLGPASDGSLAQSLVKPDPYQNHRRLLTLFDTLKRESMDPRWIWEREWLRDYYYLINRQWILYHPQRREWVDKRLHKWIPRPVTNRTASTLQAIRTNLGAINLAVKVRPVGNDTSSVAAAEIADQLAPLLHEEHQMPQVMREADFWLIANGNACLQLSWDKDFRHNRFFAQHEQCLQCGAVVPPEAVVQAGQRCPSCGSQMLQPAQNPDGSPMGRWMAYGKGKTTALSPFEYAFSPSITRWDDLPYIIRIRWRDKHWFEANLPHLVPKIVWEKAPSDRSLQIYKSLALSNDAGTGSQFSYLGAGGVHTGEGVTEYEVWVKPTPEFERGLVFRVVGDHAPIVLDLPDEGLPGPFPYTDIENNPLFPFVHAQYEHIGGRLYGRSAVSPLIQKQDQLNQVDSLIQLCLQRTANPGWIIPENAGIEQLSGEPGFVVKWNALAAQGNAKPERVAGQEIPASVMQIRAQILEDFQELCLTGETLIPCLDGQYRSMTQLVEQFPNGGMWVYGFDTETMRIVPSEIRKAWKTGTKPVYRVTFEEGTHIDCTANHPFLTYGRGYVRCDALSIGESIVPLVIKECHPSQEKTYHSVIQPVDRKTEPVHRMVAYALLGLKRGQSYLDVHHVDACGTNNLPHNLEVLTRKEHCAREPRLPFTRLSSEEYSHFSHKYWKRLNKAQRKVHLRSMRDGQRAYWNSLTPQQRSERNKAVWAKASPEFRQEVGQKGSRTKRAWSPKRRQLFKERIRQARVAFWAQKSPEERKLKGQELRSCQINHRVQSVEYLGEAEVYDLTTTTGNFGTAAEVFVHNSGAFDIFRGEKPAGLEAFSALQLMVERSQSRFTSVFQSRGEMYRRWFTLAIELERQFGPQQRTFSVVGPNRGYTLRHFENAQLQGQILVQIEDGSNMPKTALGKRAAIEQANQLRLIDPNDPEQRQALLTTFGLSDLAPTLNFHVQTALQLQDEFERWVESPVGVPPLTYKPWYDARVHWVERIKWLNTDRMKELLATRPDLELFISQHLQELQMIINPPMLMGPEGAGGPEASPPQGGALSMTNSNRESGATDTLPRGNKEVSTQRQGPR